MLPVIRYWHTVIGLANASFYIAWRYRKRKKQLMEEVSRAFPDRIVPVSIAGRLMQYIPPFLLMESLFVQLSGRVFTDEQSARSLYLNGLTPLFDDLIDEQQLDREDIQALVSGHSKPEHPKAIICRALFEQGGFVWDEYWEAIVLAQMDSKRQVNGRLSQQELFQMTVQKGAASVELGWQVITEGQEGLGGRNLAAHFGAFAQLLNDIFDVWKDREAGIQTLPTSSSDMQELRQIYRQSSQRVIATIQISNTSACRKARMRALLVPIFCLGELALENLYLLQQRNGGKFNVSAFTRRALICDMAKWQNRWRWMVLVLRWGDE
jgi:hypothetical protein